MPAGRPGSRAACAVAASTPLLPPRAPTLASCQRRIRGRCPLRSGASSGSRRNRRGDGAPGVMREESMRLCSRGRAPTALAHGPKFARAASATVGSDAELLAYETAHLAAVGAAVGLAHYRPDDRADRLLVPRAH